MKRTTKYTSSDGINTAGGTFKLLIKDKLKIFNVMLRVLAGTFTATIAEEFRVTLNYSKKDAAGNPQTDGSEIIWKLSGLKLDALNQYFGLAAFAGSIITLDFEQPNALDMRQAYATAINIGSPISTPGARNFGRYIESMLIEIDYAAAAGFTGFEISADVDAADTNGPGAIKRIKEFSSNQITSRADLYPTSGAGWQFWQGLFLDTTAGSVDPVEIECGTFGRYQYQDLALAQRRQADGFNRDSSQFDHVIDFTVKGFTEPLDTLLYGQPTLFVTPDQLMTVNGLLLAFGSA